MDKDKSLNALINRQREQIIALTAENESLRRALVIEQQKTATNQKQSRTWMAQLQDLMNA